jgi:hypothetical protein
LNDLAQRIMSLPWDPTLDRMYSRAFLMKEYLRRIAWWAKATEASSHPYYTLDIAALVDPTIRADQAVVDQVRRTSRRGTRTW